MRSLLAHVSRLTSPANPSLTPEYIVSAITTLAALFLTQGLIQNHTEKIITGCASVLIPLAFLIGQAIVKALHKPAPPAVVPPPV